ncbi:MAG: lipid A biosynthesis acyltransferase [Xanthomonadales bacterium]|nr:lipid A biosynthesis acyltransferase [Xanthomonadales bacterium]NIN60130.1 lipid A biosynthesis acyltransferase [Xanthomonadales bacterium]NIN74277.1 lipid A biosynthesis acyltransferase [Xanthomonadales bacterium]NIO12786.1 lipid A biosynthesis acyltransferase [Xanthomonadales bacterium]NIP12523.1 lipid A biosynthesis acyltransferase [Xanthomonadales bacterium]
MGYLFLSIFLRLSSLLTPRAWRRMAGPIAGLIWLVSARLRTATLINLALAYPELTQRERTRLGRESLRHYVLNIVEVGAFWYWPLERLDALVDPPAGRRHYEEAKASGRGIVFLAPHFGAWEAMTVWGRDYVDGAALYKPGRGATIQRKLRRKRKRFGMRLVPATRAGLRVIYQSLHEGKAVGVLPDQEPSLGQGHFAPFFGVPALTATLVPRLIRKTGCRVVFAVCMRTPGGRFQLHFVPPEEAIHSEDLDTALAALNRGVERCIALDPAQYLWPYKRFKHRPPGEARIYRKKSRPASG